MKRLSDLRNDLLTMAGLTERSFYRAINGLLQRDDTLCTKAIADDEEVDQLEKQIDKAGLEFCFAISRSRPIYGKWFRQSNFRPTSSRVADEATNIAECRAQVERTSAIS